MKKLHEYEKQDRKAEKKNGGKVKNPDSDEDMVEEEIEWRYMNE